MFPRPFAFVPNRTSQLSPGGPQLPSARCNKTEWTLYLLDNYRSRDNLAINILTKEEPPRQVGRCPRFFIPFVRLLLLSGLLVAGLSQNALAQCWGIPVDAKGPSVRLPCGTRYWPLAVEYGGEIYVEGDYVVFGVCTVNYFNC